MTEAKSPMLLNIEQMAVTHPGKYRRLPLDVIKEVQAKDMVKVCAVGGLGEWLWVEVLTQTSTFWTGRIRSELQLTKHGLKRNDVIKFCHENIAQIALLQDPSENPSKN